MKRLLTVTLLIFYGIIASYAQYISVSIEEKIMFSDLIIEGEVMSKSTFKDINDGYIYTSNKILLKKNIQ